MCDSDELGKLGDLHQRGILSDEEFQRAKARVLGSPPRSGGPSRSAGRLNSFRRSRDERWLGGVCGGLGAMTDTPAWLWRLLFTLLVLFCGTGVLAYLLLWFFVPAEPLPPPTVAAGYTAG